ncbi:sporulation-induced protein [Paecilomyces lecythidis]|uniref:Sporulation-induced protein n=1 Tax=Paecilomyces lecythidis TaxID=3004212 RepID=A0ABR3X5S9_9EURO
MSAQCLPDNENCSSAGRIGNANGVVAVPHTALSMSSLPSSSSLPRCLTSSNSTSQPIPILAPPPGPLNPGPSRARRQLAARLALQKQQATDAAATEENSSEGEKRETTGEGEDQWATNPFVISGLDDDLTESPASATFPSMDFPSRSADISSSPTFPRSGFTPPGSPSPHSSDDGREGTSEAVRRKERMPLEVEDDDEMGEMVGPSTSSGAGMTDSDEEDEAIINESLGYASFYGPGRYTATGRPRVIGSHFGPDADEQDDSSDGEDEGLVEILVPGRKSSASN